MKFHHLCTIVIIALALCQTLLVEAASKACWTANPLHYFHGWIRHGDSCPGIYGCDQATGSLPFTAWDNVGFESKTGDRVGPGQLREDKTLSCVVWKTLSVSANCSRWAIKYLVSKGWNTAHYAWTAARPYCPTLNSDCSPLSSNVCWTFQCSYFDCAIQKCPFKMMDEESLMRIPDDWSCDKSKYGDGVCDCNCGGWDIDCEDLSLPTSGCAADQVCLPGNECFPRSKALAERKLFYQQVGLEPTHKMDYAKRFGAYTARTSEVPSSWHCPADYYNAKDGCDCNCGAYDPDCDDDQSLVLNCGSEPYLPGEFKCDATTATCVRH